MASVTESPADVARLIFGAANRAMESYSEALSVGLKGVPG
jgi:hypothetical protein